MVVLCCRAGGLPQWTAEDAGGPEAKPHLAEAVQTSPGGHPGREAGEHGDKESEFRHHRGRPRLPFGHRAFLNQQRVNCSLPCNLVHLIRSSGAPLVSGNINHTAGTGISPVSSSGFLRCHPMSWPPRALHSLAAFSVSLFLFLCCHSHIQQIFIEHLYAN